MTDRIRLLILLARPAVVVLLGLFTAIGLAQAGQSGNHLLLAQGLAAVMGFLLFSVALNDLADEAIDRVNLPGDRRRPLVAGTATRRELVATAAGAAVVALGVSATLHWAATVAVAAGLVLSAAYSLRPPRVADRGWSPACCYRPATSRSRHLVGVLGTRGSIHSGDLALLGGLYAGFIGRIVLKDFRDVTVTGCSASAPSWSATGGAGPARSARPAGSRGRPHLLSSSSRAGCWPAPGPHNSCSRCGCCGCCPSSVGRGRTTP